MKEKLILIGNGMAGMRTIDELLKRNPDLYEISVFGTEPRGNYNRILLSPVLAGEKSLDDIMIHDKQWYVDNHITLYAGKDFQVTDIKKSSRTITTQNGETFHYDKLIIATGSHPTSITPPGANLNGILTFRDIDDITQMEAAAKIYKHAVVIGGGLLGLEAAYGLEKKGMHVTVLHRSQALLNRQLDEAASQLLKNALIEKNLTFKLGVNTTEFIGDENGRVKALTLDDGTTIPAELVVIAIGVQPNKTLGELAGLTTNKGIAVNDVLQTSDANIYAVGECVEFDNNTFGLVAPLYDQAIVLAEHLALSHNVSPYHIKPVSTQLKVSGINLFSAGEFMGTEHSEEIIYKDKKHGIYKKLVVEYNKLIGAVIYGDTKDSLWYFDKINSQQDISSIRNTLIYGQAYTDESL